MARRLQSLATTHHLQQIFWPQNGRRRDGRVAEGARLESVFTRKGNVGSNPTLSASSVTSSTPLYLHISSKCRGPLGTKLDLDKLPGFFGRGRPFPIANGVTSCLRQDRMASLDSDRLYGTVRLNYCFQSHASL